MIHSSLLKEAVKSGPVEFLLTQMSGASLSGREENLGCPVHRTYPRFLFQWEKEFQSQVQASVLW